MTIADTYFWLIAAHFVCDFPLQGDWLARSKNPYEKPVPGEVIWPISLLAHSYIHAAGVYLVTHSSALAVVELLTHAFIDYLKCKGSIGYVYDQFLHLQMKMLYIAVIYFAGMPI